MYDVNPKLQEFLKTISKKIDMEVETFEMLISYLSILEAHQFRKIE